MAKRGTIDLMEGLTLAVRRVATTAIPSCRAAYAAPIRIWASDLKAGSTAIWASRAGRGFPGQSQVRRGHHIGRRLLFLVLAGQLAIDPAERMESRDDDGKGAVDDRNGSTCSHGLEPVAAPLPPPSRKLAPQFAF